MKYGAFDKIEAPLSENPQPVSAPLDWPFDQQVMLCNLSFHFVCLRFSQSALGNNCNIKLICNSTLLPPHPPPPLRQ